MYFWLRIDKEKVEKEVLAQIWAIYDLNEILHF